MSNESITGYDFAGWATRTNIKCSDGRTIRDGAFAHMDGKRVPLVYMHDHADINNVLGYVLLKDVPSKGTRAYGYFNETANGQVGKEAVMHGDLTSLSVFANHLRQKSGDVLHGEIKEVSLVQAGANPGALIDVIMSHSDDDGDSEETAFITWGEDDVLEVGEEESIEHADDKTTDSESSSGGKTAQEIFDSMTPEQQNCCFFMMEKAVEMSKDEGSEEETVEHSDDDEEDTEENDEPETEETAEEPENTETNEEENDVEMKHNAFTDANATVTEQEALCHSFIEGLDFEELIKSSKSAGKTFGQTFLAHADEYGIENLDLLFPDYKSLTNMPEFIKRPDDWVSKILNGVKKVPFAKVRTLFADITADEARARGYTKGHKKVEEVFTLLKREVGPTTIYKKQKLDRDDVIDLANLDIIGWLRQEMRMMLDEEIARAILVSDGRDPLADADNKIKEDKIIPMIYDDVLFTINKDTTGAAKNIIQTAIRARKDYRGSGKPVFITTEDYVTEMLLMEDLNQRVIYETEDKLKTALRVTDIITSPVLEGVQNKAGTKELVAIIVNLGDYTIGADKGGSINWFDDFDIDFNQQKYLIETRCSGALTKPKSCIVLWKPVSQQASEPVEEPANNG